jgi:predicted O-methyltransferase YrrM
MSLGGKALYVITRVVKPRSIMEIGVANGMSTAYILGALSDGDISPESVTIHAIDRPQFAYQIRERRGRFGVEGIGGLILDNKEVGWMAPNDIKSKYNYQLHIGDFTHILEDILETSGNLDLAVYDASKDSDEMKFAYQNCINKLNEGGVLVSDDVLVNDTFENIVEAQDGQYRIINDTGIYRYVRLS